jgi:hypothetical protein
VPVPAAATMLASRVPDSGSHVAAAPVDSDASVDVDSNVKAPRDAAMSSNASVDVGSNVKAPRDAAMPSDVPVDVDSNVKAPRDAAMSSNVPVDVDSNVKSFDAPVDVDSQDDAPRVVAAAAMPGEVHLDTGDAVDSPDVGDAARTTQRIGTWPSSSASMRPCCSSSLSSR